MSIQCTERKISHCRARGIVKLAAKEINIRRIKIRLLEDTFGAFEKQAIELVAQIQEKATEAKVSNAEVDREVSIYLAYLTLESEKKNTKKGT